MNTALVNVWNKSNQAALDGKNPSLYAVEKESRFPRDAVICDLGGGLGADACYFLSKGHRVTLVDISDFALDVAKKKAEELGYLNRLKTFQLDLSEDSLPLDDNSVDVVYSRLAVHYFNKNRTVEIFKEIKRVLNNDANAFITIKSPDDIEEMAFLKNTSTEVEPSVFVKDSKIKSMYSIEQVNNMLESASIQNAIVKSYIENLEATNDKTASGVKRLTLTEITFTAKS